MKPYLTLLNLIIGIIFIILYLTIQNPIWQAIDLTLAIYNISVFTNQFWKMIEND